MPQPSDNDLYQLVDMHGQKACFITSDFARDLLKQGFAYLFGSKQKTHGLRLTVSIHKAMGIGNQRPLTASSSTGTRFVYKEKIRIIDGTTHVTYRHKKMDVRESPEFALQRILTPPAMESAVYKPYRQCSPDERRSDPSAERRRAAKKMFRIKAGFIPSRAPSVARPASAR